MKPNQLPPFRDEGNTRVAAYESYLDLFTLLSFILIITAFIYVARSDRRDQNLSSVAVQVAAQVAERGSGVPQRLPSNTLLLVIYREDSIDKLAIIAGASGTTNQLEVTVEDVDRVMNGFTSMFDSTSMIDVALYKGKEDVNPGIFLAVSRWLANHKYNRYRVYYYTEG